VFDPAPGTPNLSAYTGPQPLIYLEYNNLVNGGQWNKSNSAVDTDPHGPGLNFVKATNGTDSVCPDPFGNTGFYAPFGADGRPSIDQVTGKVFQAEFSDNSILLNIGTPDASGNLTFLDAPSTAQPCGDQSKLITVANNVPNLSSEAANFVVSSMDSARNLYVTWVSKSNTPSQRQTYVSVASAASGWRTWSPAQRVSSSPSMVAVFPWVAAGGAGRADVVWYGSNIAVDPSNQLGQQWDVFMAQVIYPVDSTGAVTGAVPSVTQVKVTPHPMHYNDICLAGTDCIQSQGNRNLADFFNLAIDSNGAAVIVYDDTSNGLAQPGFTPDNVQLVDHAGAGVITIARQSSGLGLYGKTVSGRSNAPVNGMSDNSGDALYPVIGGSNVPGLDILGSSISLSGSTLTVTTKIADLSNPGATASAVPGTNFLQYVTRWQMGNTIYYAAMENTAANVPTFYAGKAGSVDLCSVSACFPHVITYPEPSLGGTAEKGTISCPATPSASNPCTLTVNVNVGDVGNPTSTSLLEEVGSYALVSTVQSGAITNAGAEADNVPLEIDGLCCYNNVPQPPAPPPCHKADGNGSVKGKGSQNAGFAFHHDDCAIKPDSASFTDPGGNANFQSAQMNSVTYDDVLHSVTIIGSGTDNGLPVTFTMIAVDSTLAAPGSFSITLSDGYVLTGSLLSGSVSLQ
jgi:hypothetical protein